MQHAWDSYREYAWGSDELLPISKKGSNRWGGYGVTLVDSLDTLFLMGLGEEFEQGGYLRFIIYYSLFIRVVRRAPDCNDWTQRVIGWQAR